MAKFAWAKGRSSNRNVPKTYTIKKDDTLLLIAKKQLGDENKWEHLRKINNLPNAVDLEIGRVIRLE